MDWDRQVVNIGYLNPKAKYTFVYKYQGTKTIKSVKPLCQNCTNTNFKNNTVEVVFIAEGKPKHLKDKEVYVMKEVEVIFTDGTVDKLMFNGILR